jgi:tripartite-type tricarboxylate transporter receptor subunit TctC
MASTAGDHREEHRPARAGRARLGRGVRRRPQRRRAGRQRPRADRLREGEPGKLRFGSSGIGAASHLSGELFKAQAHVDMQHVPYKGTGQALTDLLGGQIEVMFAPTQTVIPQLQSGRLKAIAVTGTRPLEALPNLPTVAASGLPGYQAQGWFGLLAPKATPPALVARLHDDVNKVLALADVRKDLIAKGAEPGALSAPSSADSSATSRPSGPSSSRTPGS